MLEVFTTSYISEPEAILTPFCWSVVGPVPTKALFSSSPGLYVNHICLSKKDKQIKADIAKLWETKVVGCIKTCRTIRTAEDKKEMQILDGSIRHTGERQEVAFTWKEDDITLTNNYGDSLRQINRLCLQFEKNPIYTARYDKNIQEYVKLKFIVP